jgi:hypothetical protein
MLLLALTPLAEAGVQLIAGANFRYRDEGVQPHVLNQAFHLALLIPALRVTEVAIEQVVGPQALKSRLLLPVVPLQDPLYGHFQVVVGQPAGDHRRT